MATMIGVQPGVLAGFSPVALPIERVEGYLFVAGAIAGQPVRLLIDSGAGANVITPEIARRLRLPLRAAGPVVGAGAEPVAGQTTTLPRLALGVASWSDESVYVVPLPPAIGCDGILGYDFFHRFVVTIDYERRRLTLTPPAQFRPPAGARLLPLRLRGRTPEVQGIVDGTRGWFTLDTGAGDALTLFTPFVEKYRLRERYWPRLETVTGRGVGGLTYGDLVRIRALQIGPFAIESLVTDLSRQQQGDFSDAATAGNIGAEVLSRFTVTFDYRRQRLFLTPNRDFRKPSVGTRTGFGLDYDGDVHKVVAVLPDSPAAEAGLLEGDTVLAVDNLPIARMDLRTIRAALRQPPGSKLHLFVRTRDGALRMRILTLRNLL